MTSRADVVGWIHGQGQESLQSAHGRLQTAAADLDATRLTADTIRQLDELAELQLRAFCTMCGVVRRHRQDSAEAHPVSVATPQAKG